jgi:Zn-dependent protease
MLRFPLFGIPVTVRPSFWLVAILLGFDGARRAGSPVRFLAVWCGIVLVSVLAHELGHATMARRFGARARITLFALGGVTTWEARPGLSPWRRVAVAAAGSGVGFVLAGVAWVLLEGPLDQLRGLPRTALALFVRVNVLWGILNWLPIRPLDGGHIFAGVLQAVFGRAGRIAADVMFPLFTLAAGWWAWSNGLIFAALLAVFVLADEVRRWTAPRAGPPPEDFRLFED